MGKLIDQYVNLKHYAINYLSQIDDLVQSFYNLKYKLTEILFDIETKAEQFFINYYIKPARPC